MHTQKPPVVDFKTCGCGYTWELGIQMCPMHDSAPDLLAALEGMKAVVENVGDSLSPETWLSSNEWHAAVDAMEAAIARAKP